MEHYKREVVFTMTNTCTYMYIHFPDVLGLAGRKSWGRLEWPFHGSGITCFKRECLTLLMATESLLPNLVMFSPVSDQLFPLWMYIVCGKVLIYVITHWRIYYVSRNVQCVGTRWGCYMHKQIHFLVFQRNLLMQEAWYWLSSLPSCTDTSKLGAESAHTCCLQLRSWLTCSIIWWVAR